jgi:hypothetical protein
VPEVGHSRKSRHAPMTPAKPRNPFAIRHLRAAHSGAIPRANHI